MSVSRLLRSWVLGLVASYTFVYWFSEFLQWDMHSPLFTGNNVLIFYMVIGWALLSSYLLQKRMLKTASERFEHYLLNELSDELTLGRQKQLTDQIKITSHGVSRQISISTTINYVFSLLFLFALGILSSTIIAVLVGVAVIMHFIAGLRLKDYAIEFEAANLLLSVLHKTSMKMISER